MPHVCSCVTVRSSSAPTFPSAPPTPPPTHSDVGNNLCAGQTCFDGTDDTADRDACCQARCPELTITEADGFEPTVCPAHDRVAGVEGQTYATNAACQLTCAYSQQQPEPSSIECQTDGTYEALPTTCPAWCPPVSVSPMTTSAGASCGAADPASSPTCPVSCASGFNIESGASNEITCNSEGVWSAFPACEAFSCPEGRATTLQLIPTRTSITNKF